ncbi:MAG: hypothetical protein R2795_19675 [Saprospiraceae bacterium]
MSVLSVQHTAKTLLGESLIYLKQLEGEDYTRPISLLSGATLGQHTRHYIEFYQCLLHSATHSEVVNYDNRKRDFLLERSAVAAIEAIEAIVAQLQYDEDWVLQLEQSYQLGQVLVVPTTFSRELIYNIEHTIHHLAIIRIGLKVVCSDMPLPEGFGVAPSNYLAVRAR